MPEHTCYRCSKPGAPVVLEMRLVTRGSDATEPAATVERYYCPKCGGAYEVIQTKDGGTQLSVA